MSSNGVHYGTDCILALCPLTPLSSIFYYDVTVRYFLGNRLQQSLAT